MRERRYSADSLNGFCWHGKVDPLDTEVYVRLGLNFENPKLVQLVNLISSQKVELLITEVVRREVETDLIERSNELWQKCQGLASDIERTGARRSLPGLPTALRRITQASIQEAMLGGFKDFQNRAKVKQIPTPPSLLPKLLDDYFTSTPPFAVGKKQKEFPDAISLYAIAAYAEEKDWEVIVVSGDEDIKKACDRFDHLRNMAAIEDVMAEIVHEEALLYSTVENVSLFLAKPPPGLLLDIAESFENLSFYWTGWDRGDVIEVYDVMIKGLHDGTVLGVQADRVFANVDADIKFTAEVSLDSPVEWVENYPRQRGAKRDNTLTQEIVVSVDLRVIVNQQGTVTDWTLVQLNDGNDVEIS